MHPLPVQRAVRGGACDPQPEDISDFGGALSQPAQAVYNGSKNLDGGLSFGVYYLNSLSHFRGAVHSFAWHTLHKHSERPLSMNENDIDVLVKQLKNRDPDVRFDAVKALEMAGGDNVLPIIISALQDRDSGVAFLAEQVLIRIGSIQAKKALAKHYKKSTSKLPTGRIGQPVVVALSGVTFDGRARTLSQARSGEIVELVRRPNNIHDRNAIECLRRNGDSLGWLPKEIAHEYSILMDQGYPLYGCIMSIVGGRSIKPSIGARVIIGWSEAEVATRLSMSQKDSLLHSKDSRDRHYDEYDRDEYDRDDEINRLQDMRDDSGYDDHNYDNED